MTKRTTHLLALALLAVLLTGLSVAATSSSASHQVVVRQALVDGHGVKWWARRARANRAAVRWQQKRADRLETRVAELRREARKAHEPNAIEAIRYVFGAHADEAVRVFYCETGGTYSPYATNGQYLGVAQMGSYARARYGHSNNVWGQVISAYRYFSDAGWGPWECAGIVGIR